MKIIVYIILILITGFVKAGQPVVNSDVEILKNIKLKLWPQAYQEQDSELLGKILHPQFQMIDANGEISTREQELATLEKLPWNPQNFIYHIERIEVFDGDTAVISGRGETDTYSYRSSNVLIKQSGEWQAILSHVSGFKQK